MIEYRGHKYQKASGSRVLYHIGPRPPKPELKYKSQGLVPGLRGYDVEPGYSRPWLKNRTDKVVFLTPNPVQVWIYHGITSGNVYTYRVPNWVVQEAGGIHRYDDASEVIIPEHLWSEVEFLGKAYEKDEFQEMVEQEYLNNVDRRRQKNVRLEDHEREEADQVLRLHNRRIKHS